MSVDFPVPEGWEEFFKYGPTKGPVLILYGGFTTRYFRQKEPVPPLPTEPYTVIRVTFGDSSQKWDAVFTLKRDRNDAGPGYWDNGSKWSEEALAERITSFEILSEPRAETAKAVLDRVRKRVLGATSWSRTGMDEIAREFGVTK